MLSDLQAQLKLLYILKSKLQFSATHDGLFPTEVQRSRRMNLESIVVTKI